VGDDELRQAVAANARRIVVKVGTHALTLGAGRLDEEFVGHLSGQIAGTMRGGVEVALVSSGAIGAGVAELDLPGRPKTLPMLQATAAIGQGQLMRTFHDAFARYGVKVAQILVTRDDFQSRTRYLNIRNTVAALADCRALPIINENDTVSVDEIRFGDNDVIAALVANMIDADLLVLLTDVDGFVRDGEVVDVVERIDQSVLDGAGGSSGRLGVGGQGHRLGGGDGAYVNDDRHAPVLGSLLKSAASAKHPPLPGKHAVRRSILESPQICLHRPMDQLSTATRRSAGHDAD